MSIIKKTFKSEFLPILLIIISIILSFIFYSKFPDKVASHWNFAGQIDGWMTKCWASFLFPVIMIFMYLLFLVLPSLDPKKDRYKEFNNTYHIFKNILIVFLFIIYLITGLFNIGYDINVTMAITILVGMLMIILGAYMHRIKNNWFIGIRNPWTLSSEKVWNKTHRFGGWMFVLFGVLIATTSFIPESMRMYTFLAGLIIVVLGTFIYSYITYRKEEKKK